MTERRGASDTRLMGPQPSLINEPLWDWSRDWARIAARARELVANDPFAAAMVQCKLDNTHGPDGLRPVSLAQADSSKPVDQADYDLRESIERLWSDASGTSFDAEDVLSRKAMDRQLDWLATVTGEGFAIREWQNGRNVWRVVQPERVSNPDDRPNDARLYHGFEKNAKGQWVALWVETTHAEDFGAWSKRTWTRVERYAKDGTPNIVHRVGWRDPGSLRGISMFAPILMMAKQIGGTIEAHVTAKRAQACNPVIYYVPDPVEAAKAARVGSEAVVGPHTRFNPLQVYYAQFGSQVQFTNTNFNGLDLEAFLKIGYRVLCSVWQMPVEVVLCQMGEASLASARAGLDQVDRTAQNWQGDHIEQASTPFDSSTVAGAVLVGKLKAGPSGLRALCLARYRRPPKYSTDRLKDANTIEKLNDNGVSPTTSFGLFGLDYEEETDQAIRDERYAAKQREAAGLPPLPEDMTKFNAGSVAAIAAGLSNFKIEHAKRGQDYKQVFKQLAQERSEAAALGLKLDLSGTNAPAPDSTIAKEEPAPEPANEPAPNGGAK